MSQEIAEVQNQININFATIIENSGVDYRVIMLADFGENVNESVCISAPLSIGNCNPVPAMPANNPISTNNHLWRLLATGGSILSAN